MRYLPNGKQMKAADAYTIEQREIPSLVLMERAALAAVDAIAKNGFDLKAPLIVCGSGNNGGDGFAMARILGERKIHAEVLFAGNESSMSSECALQKRAAEKSGVRVYTEIPEKEYTVIIDALFGVGLSREISGKYRDLLVWMNSRECGRAAVDVPSGICADTGKVLGIAFRAQLTVAMACVKRGCELYPGKEYAGKTTAVPIGIDPDIFYGNPDVCMTYDPEDLPGLLPERKENSNKGTFGKVLMVTGSRGMAGAAYLSARAAYAAGAGLVRIYTSEENRTILQQLLPEAIITCYSGYDGDQIKELVSWADVICAGCGIGQSETAGNLLKDVLLGTDKTRIIDADGLNLLSRNMDILRSIHGPVILTPHMKEMSRLTGKTIGELADDRLKSAEEFAKEYPVVCVMKDSRTVVAQSGMHSFLNLAGNSAMAKAGSGDVLAGVITGLAAQGMTGFESAALGVFLHASGGDAARNCKGSYSVQARDLIDGIEYTMKSAEEKKIENKK